MTSFIVSRFNYIFYSTNDLFTRPLSVEGHRVLKVKLGLHGLI